MRLTTKEKAGIPDVSKIYEKLHLTDEFIERFTLNPDTITEPDFIRSAELHFEMCDECRKKREGYLPLTN